jgi:hypothetical protein
MGSRREETGLRVELHAPQEEAVEKMHNGCVLYGGVGVGKTITSLAYYFSKVCGGTINEWGSLQTPKDVYVITTAKVRDSKAFELQAAHFGIHENREISTNGVKITVDSWNNLHKYVEVKDAFFIFDEQRVVGYGAWSRAFIKIARNNNEWILCSATPGDTWMDYIPVFIANGFYKHKTDFIDQHVIWTPRVKYPKVLRYQNIGALVRRRNDVLVHMPVERHTVRHHVDVWCDYDQDAFDKAVKKRWHVFENRPLRDVSELFSVMRKVVNSDASRLEEVRRLLEKHPKVIVFYNFDYELEMLRSLGGPTGSDSQDPLIGTIWEEGFDEKTGKVLSSSDTSQDAKDDTAATFALAEWNGHKHEEIPKTDRWVYLVQYRAGAEGWNCIDTDAMVFFSQTYSYRDWWQAHGRIDRINTPFTDLWYYHFVSRSIIDKAIRKALKVKKSFNERDLRLEAA